jgi:KUP system potassium uptake protein
MPRHGRGTAALALGALGVVYGDIGTSPLYTIKEVLNRANGVQLNATDIVTPATAESFARLPRAGDELIDA